MKTAALLSLALVGSLTACASAHVTTDWDREMPFGSYKTYAWMETPRMEAMQQNSLFDRRLRTAVEAELSSKGYTKAAPDKIADVLVAYHVGVKDKIDVQQWGYAGRRWDTREYQEGTLIIDLVDGRSRSLAWRGTAQGELRAKDTSSEQIGKAVQKMFAALPSS